MKLASSFVFFLNAICFTACQKGISNNMEINGGVDTTNNNTPAEPPANQDSYTYYYKANINGVNYSAGVTDDNGYQAGSGMSGVEEAKFGAGINPPSNTTGLTGMGIEKGVMYGYYNSTDDEFRAFFSPGTYPYAIDANGGIEISWQDEAGNYWSTGKGIAGQTGSTFKITAIKGGPSLINLYIEVSCEFNCKLYDDSGHVKIVTNGKFVGLFGKI